MRPTKRLNEIFTYGYISDPDNYTVFRMLSAESLMAGIITDGNYADIDLEYFLGTSGDKFISPLLEKLMEDLNGDIYDVSKQIEKIIFRRFGDKWKRLHDALVQEYNPLENYSMEEIRTPDLTTDETSNTKTDITVDKDSEVSNSYKGFNATDPSLVSKSEGDETTTTTGAKADNEVSKKTEETGSETTTRSGNIGVTTSQQMLESEFKVRQYDFYRQIYSDVDSVLCLSIY